MLLTLLSFKGTPPPPTPPDDSDIIAPTRTQRVRKIDDEDFETLEIFTTALLIYHRNGQI